MTPSKNTPCGPCTSAFAEGVDEGHEDCTNPQEPRDLLGERDFIPCCCGFGERMYDQLKAVLDARG